MQTPDEKLPDEKSIRPAKKISRRELVFVEHLLANKVPTVAARLAGFSESICLGQVHSWIRETRDESRKPELFDYYQKRLNHSLRILDIDAKKILRELALIGFASIDRFIDFPSRQDARDEAAKDAETRQFMGLATDEDLALIEQNKKDHADDENDSRSWKKYRPGSIIKLKAIEDIPAELFPVIESISETKEGIRIKLFNKLDALDKLARIMKMYPSDQDPSKDETLDMEISLVVKGSRSPLLLGPK